MSAIAQALLDQARWAPSGDNTQPWRFRVISDNQIEIHGHDTREDCVYDLDGHPSHIAHGCLLETLRIAATERQLRLEWSLRAGCPEASPIYDVRLSPDSELQPDPLLPCIPTRTVQRRPMSSAPLEEAHVKALNTAAAPFRVVWMTTLGERLALARLNYRSAHIRLSIPEAFEVHRRVIEWRTKFSTDRIPERAVGIDPLVGRLMQWLMGSWGRVEFFNTFLAGTVAPRLQLDFLPGVSCAGHALLVAPAPPQSTEDYVRAGMAIQRFWLEAEHCGVQLQPEMTPLIFSRYAREGRAFTRVAKARDEAADVAERVNVLFGNDDSTRGVFLCRVGYRPKASSRSLRKPLADLLLKS